MRSSPTRRAATPREDRCQPAGVSARDGPGRRKLSRLSLAPPRRLPGLGRANGRPDSGATLLHERTLDCYVGYGGRPTGSKRILLWLGLPSFRVATQRQRWQTPAPTSAGDSGSSQRGPGGARRPIGEWRNRPPVGTGLRRTAARRIGRSEALPDAVRERCTLLRALHVPAGWKETHSAETWRSRIHSEEV